MSDYVSYLEIASHLPINKSDILYIASDILELAKTCRQNGERFDPAAFIRSFQDAVGEGGTLLFPTFNWDFCRGTAFDYHKTPGKTGALGNAALRMPEFIRTKHPLYSFAVWGKDADMLYAMENTSSFGDDSPFAYLHKNGAKNLMIGVDMPRSFTFTHYVEEQCRAPYRYLKNFTADYTDADGNTSMRTYSMYVRDLERNVTVRLEPIQREFVDAGVAQRFVINGIACMSVDLSGAYDLMSRDVLENRGRKMTVYDGQED